MIPTREAASPLGNDPDLGVSEIKARNRPYLRPGNGLHGHEKHTPRGPKYLIEIISRDVNVYRPSLAYVGVEDAGMNYHAPNVPGTSDRVC